MNKKWKKTMTLLALVACLGVLSIGSAAVVSADEPVPGEETTDEVTKFGKGTLSAEGDGIAILGGRGMVDVIGNGILWIKDVRGDALVRVTGQGNKTEFPDGWIQYAGFDGHAYVEGSGVVVGIAGVDIELLARGRGRALLWGHGTYDRGDGIVEQAGEWGTRFRRPLRFGPATPDVMPAA